MPAADGTTDFSVLQNELKGKSKKIVMVAFDLLYLNGCELRKLPLDERKALLKKLVAGTAIQFSESVQARLQSGAGGRCIEGPRQQVCEWALEDWVKITCAQRETLTIAGFAFDGNKWDGLYIGRRKGPDLVLCRQG